MICRIGLRKFWAWTKTMKISSSSSSIHPYPSYPYSPSLLPWWMNSPRHRFLVEIWSCWSDRSDTPNATEYNQPVQTRTATQSDQSSKRGREFGDFCGLLVPNCTGPETCICRKIGQVRSGSVRSSHLTVSDYILRAWFPNTQQFRFLTACWRLEKLVLPSIFDTSLSSLMTWNLQSYPTTVLNGRMWHFCESKRTCDPPTYFQG